MMCAIYTGDGFETLKCKKGKAIPVTGSGGPQG
jgi:hypothetical protein